MIKYENDCVGCDACYNCGRRHSPHYYCDDCGEEIISGGDYLDPDENHYCDDCKLQRELEDYLTLENVLAYGDWDDDEINDFYDKALSKSVKEEICRKYVESLSPEKRKELYKWYVDYIGIEEFLDDIKACKTGGKK